MTDGCKQHIRLHPFAPYKVPSKSLPTHHGQPTAKNCSKTRLMAWVPVEQALFVSCISWLRRACEQQQEQFHDNLGRVFPFPPLPESFIDFRVSRARDGLSVWSCFSDGARCGESKIPALRQHREWCWELYLISNPISVCMRILVLFFFFRTLSVH